MKKMLSGIMVVIMMLFVCTVAAFAADVCTVGGIGYESLQAAVDANTTGTIVLTGNVEVTTKITVPSGTTLILDLNGYTISSAPTMASASAVIENKGTLTITDSKSGGKITTSASNPDMASMPGYASNTINNRGILTINAGTIENTTNGVACYAIDNYSGVVTVNGGIITSRKVAIRQFSSSTVENTVIINGGAVSGTYAVLLQLASSDTTVAPDVNLTVNGGTLTTTGSYGIAVYSYSDGNARTSTDITITGGTFNGDVVLAGGANEQSVEKIAITGGTFNGDYGTYSYSNYTKPYVSGGTFTGEYAAEYVAYYMKDEVEFITDAEGNIYIGDAVYDYAYEQKLDRITDMVKWYVMSYIRQQQNKKYTITAEVGEGGSIEYAGKLTVLRNNDKTITIKADEGYEVESVIVDGKDLGAITKYKFDNVKADHTIQVTFKVAEDKDEAPVKKSGIAAFRG